ncbi:MAG: DUF4271 domain-containing protein [Paraprevotella sp.]|nr:DUF4271 domain-containing protein [Paraprevotella sp.]
MKQVDSGMALWPVGEQDTMSVGALFDRDSVSLCSELEDDRLGVWGESLAYDPQRDDGVVLLLLVCLLGICVVGASGKSFFLRLFKGFFNISRTHDSSPSVKTGRDVRCLFFLTIQSACLYGLLYSYCSGALFSVSVPVLLLGINIAISLLFQCFKLLAYSFVNGIFYDKWKHEEWKNAYLFVVSMEGVVLYPLAFSTVFYALSVQNVVWGFVILHILMRILLFYKSFAIFFRDFHGLLHLFVYFCALEIVPICVFVRILAYVNEIILTKI